MSKPLFEGLPILKEIFTGAQQRKAPPTENELFYQKVLEASRGLPPAIANVMNSAHHPRGEIGNPAPGKYHAIYEIWSKEYENDVTLRKIEWHEITIPHDKNERPQYAVIAGTATYKKDKLEEAEIFLPTKYLDYNSVLVGGLVPDGLSKEEIKELKKELSPVRGNVKFFKPLVETQDVEDLTDYKYFQKPGMREHYENRIAEHQKQAEDLVKKYGSFEKMKERGEELDQSILMRKRDVYAQYRDNFYNEQEREYINSRFDHMPIQIRVATFKELQPQIDELDKINAAIKKHEEITQEIERFKSHQVRMDEVLTLITDPEGLEEKLKRQFDDGVKDIAVAYNRFGQLKVNQPEGVKLLWSQYEPLSQQNPSLVNDKPEQEKKAALTGPSL